MHIWQSLVHKPDVAHTIQHKTCCTRRNLLNLWLYIQLCAHCAVYRHIYITVSCINAYQQYHTSWGTILTHCQMSRVCTLAFLQPPYLFVFPWRCTTRPWRAVKVMPVVQRWKCVRGGRLRGPAWNLQSLHRVPGRGPAPSRATTEQERREERADGHWKHGVHQHVALKSHRYCFTWRHVSLLLSDQPVTSV